MRAIRRIFAVCVMIYLMTVLVVAGFAVALGPRGAEGLQPTDVIVVLGAGMDADGTLHPSSERRVDLGVALWQAGLAPALHFTGGMGRPGGPSAGGQMAARAMAQGVPEAAITTEGRSLSTLQNALFSQPMLAEARSLRLVTEGFHLPRAWASFAWVGDQTLYLSASTGFRPGSSVRMVLREAAAIWFNLARALVYGLAGALGVAGDTRADWLA